MSEKRTFTYHLIDRERAEVFINGQQRVAGKPGLPIEPFSSENLQACGTLLFRTLFPPGSDLHDAYRQEMGKLGLSGEKLAFQLMFSEDLAAVLRPYDWEAIFDPYTERFLGRQNDTSFSRYLKLDRDPRPAVEPPLRMLICLAAPVDAAHYKLDPIPGDLAQQIRDDLSQKVDGSKIEFSVLEDFLTVDHLRDGIQADDHHGLILIGHGLTLIGGENEMVLQDEYGNARFVPDHRFAGIFQGEALPRLVCLMACNGARTFGEGYYAGLGPQLVRQGVDSVIAVNRPISTAFASDFLAYFFKNLAQSGHVDEAVNEARHRLYQNDRHGGDWTGLVLFNRLPGGKLMKEKEKHIPSQPGSHSLISNQLSENEIGKAEFNNDVSFNKGGGTAIENKLKKNTIGNLTVNNKAR